jgi:hypothetical protein
MQSHLGVYGQGILSVQTFVDVLTELPARDWLVVGHSLIEARDRWASWQLARDALCAIVCDDELCLGAWRVRDAVETCEFLANRSRRHWSRCDRRILTTACRAAEWAALALLAHQHLAPEQFSTLYRPFAHCFPFGRGAMPSA